MLKVVLLKLNQNSYIHQDILMEESQIVVDVEASLLSELMQHKLDKLWGKPNETENCTIFRAPHDMHESKKHLLKPSVISIGPFHRGQTSLRAMEEQKWRFLRDFLSRGDHINLDLCISEMKLLEDKTRRCYSERVDLASNEFVERMLLDGCFIIEYYKNFKEKNWQSIFEVGWNYMYVSSDLMLLENQIPFFVVKKLGEISLIEEDLFNNIINGIPKPIPNYPLNPNPQDQIYHLAHLNHHYSVPTPEIPFVLSSKSFLLTSWLSPNRIKYLFFWFLSWVLTWFPGSTSQSLSMAFPNSTVNLSTQVIPCATHLQDAGIKIKQKINPKNIFDISFVHGVLEIPKLQITDDSRPLIVNLIAFEQCNYLNLDAYFSAFALFLDLLVNTQNDAMILQQCGIIENCLGGEEELTQFFNLLNEGALIEKDHFLEELFSEVNKHCESSWNRQRAKLIHDYFSSPWTAISLVAALVLLVLTCVQSFFAVYAYFVPPS